MSKFFTVEIKPIIAASKQTVNFGGDGLHDVLFDWTSFQIPKGAHRLTSVAVAFRGSNGAVQTAFEFDLHFAKTVDGVAPVTMGTVNDTMTGAPILTNHIIGKSHFEVGDFGNNGWDYIGSAQTGGGAGTSNIPSLVLQGEPDSGDNVGYDTLYIGGEMAAYDDDGFDFVSTVQVATETATNTTAVVVKTTSALTTFAVGDILHDENDQVIGTIKTITDATNLVLEENCASVSAVNKDLYNINPIKITLSFER